MSSRDEAERQLAQLRAIRELLTAPAIYLVDHGTCFARDHRGRPCSPGSPIAAAWTWRGFCCRVTRVLAERTAILDLIIAQLSPHGLPQEGRIDYERFVQAIEAAIRIRDDGI